MEDETYEMPQTHSRRDELKKDLVAWMRDWVPYYIDDGFDYGVLTAEEMEVEVVDVSEGLGGSDSNPPYEAKVVAYCPLVNDSSRVAAVSVRFDWVKKEWWTTTGRVLDRSAR